jgi:hypothetical protein
MTTEFLCITLIEDGLSANKKIWLPKIMPVNLAAANFVQVKDNGKMVLIDSRYATEELMANFHRRSIRDSIATL